MSVCGTPSVSMFYCCIRRITFWPCGIDAGYVTLGCCIKPPAENLGMQLLTHFTRNLSLTAHGALFLPEAREVGADGVQKRFQTLTWKNAGKLRVRAIDSADMYHSP